MVHFHNGNKAKLRRDRWFLEWTKEEEHPWVLPMDFYCSKDYFLLTYDISISRILFYEFLTWSIPRVLYFDYLVYIFELVEVQTLSQYRMISFLHWEAPEMQRQLSYFITNRTIPDKLEPFALIVIADTHIFNAQKMSKSTELVIHFDSLQIHGIIFDRVEDEHGSWQSFWICWGVQSGMYLLARGSTFSLMFWTKLMADCVFWKVGLNRARDFMIFLPQLSY